MTTVSLDTAKNHLRVLHNADDQLIGTYLEGAEDECLQFMNRTEFPLKRAAEISSESDISSDGSPAPSVVNAVLLLLETLYFSKTLSPYEQQLRRQRAETLCMPYRRCMGV